jgi:cation transport ATPase
MGLEVCILTGDHHHRAARLARQLKVDVQGQLLPHDKLDALRNLRAQHGSVVMVGDGVNDAPALAAADVGIALGCGADVSREAADVCLMGNQLSAIPWAVQWARDSRRVVRQNLFWAFAYNLVGVALAVTGYLNPIIAAVAMVGSSLWVVSNSLRLAPSTVTPDRRISGRSVAPTANGAARALPVDAPSANAAASATATKSATAATSVTAATPTPG